MKGKFNPFKFGVIETRYNGYKFRSRLEARWAVFFDTLGIEYQYEPEGYDLEGTWYLPDFYLPELDYFIEIKGQVPNAEELYKAKQLTLHTGKATHIIYGNIGNHAIDADFPPDAYACNNNDPRMTKDVTVPQSTLVILQKLQEIGLKCVNGLSKLVLVQELHIDERFHSLNTSLPTFIEKIQQQHDLLQKYMPFILEHEKAILSAITVEIGWNFEFSPSYHVDYLEWVQCEKCEGVDIQIDHIDHIGCQSKEAGTTNNKSTDLTDAYKAAREARF